MQETIKVMNCTHPFGRTRWHERSCRILLFFTGCAVGWTYPVFPNEIRIRAEVPSRVGGGDEGPGKYTLQVVRIQVLAQVLGSCEGSAPGGKRNRRVNALPAGFRWVEIIESDVRAHTCTRDICWVWCRCNLGHPFCQDLYCNWVVGVRGAVSAVPVDWKLW